MEIQGLVLTRYIGYCFSGKNWPRMHPQRPLKLLFMKWYQVIRKTFFFIFLLMCGFSCGLFAEEVKSYETLLTGYQKLAPERTKLDILKEMAAIDLQRFAAETGLSFSVHSGDTVFNFSSSDLYINTEPGIEMNIPGFRDTSASLKVPLQTVNGADTQYGLDLSLKTGLISRRTITHQAGMEEKKRVFIKTLRDIELWELAAEIEFCRILQELLTYQNTMLEAQGDMLLAFYDLEEKRVQGYGTSSVVLRTAELKLKTRERELLEAQRNLAVVLEEFARDCGVPQAGIPASIPEEKLISILSFNPEQFAELDDARWIYKENSLIRKAANKQVLLDGTAGYSWTSSSFGRNNSFLSHEGSAVNGGLGLNINESTLYAGVSVPLENPSEPTLTVAFSWRPWGSIISKLDKQLRSLEASRELENIAQAERTYRDLVIQFNRKKGNLEWQQSVYDEEAELYRQNAEEQKRWFDQGIIRQTDYLDAQTDYLLSLNRVLSASIERRLYNLEVKSLFIPQTTEEYQNEK